MPGIDWEKGRERLRAVYAAMSDGELQEVATRLRKHRLSKVFQQ